jgi:hypothetical protein
MASSSTPTQSAATAAKSAIGTDISDGPQDAAGFKPRLRVSLRLADIIQLNITIGRSRFGQVKLAKSRQTDEIYALKALQKSRRVTFMLTHITFSSLLSQHPRTI